MTWHPRSQSNTNLHGQHQVFPGFGVKGYNKAEYYSLSKWEHSIFAGWEAVILEDGMTDL